MKLHAETAQHGRNDAVSDSIPFSKYTKRVELRTLLDREDGGVGLAGKRVVIGGWVNSSRMVEKESPPSYNGDRTPPQEDASGKMIIPSRKVTFARLRHAFAGRGSDRKSSEPTLLPSYVLSVSDGSSVSAIQVVVDSKLCSLPASQSMQFGACVLVEGVLKRRTAVAGDRRIELKAEKLLHVGAVDQEKYPLSQKEEPLRILREYSHLRPRTAMDNGFHHVQVPIITTTDAEGCSKKFNVTTVLGESRKYDKEEGLSLDTVQAAVKEKSNKVDELKRSESNREALFAAMLDLKKTSDLALLLKERQKSKPETTPEKVNASEDFFTRESFLIVFGRLHLENYFEREAFLTVYGRLHLESYACALGNVYTFGPRFRADKIDSPSHMAETWNVETEMAFTDLDVAMTCSEDLLKFLCRYILDQCSEDMKFISKVVDKTILNRLEGIRSNCIPKISYSEVINALQTVRDKEFEAKPEFGVALTTEHLSYLTDQVYKAPIFIYNYPKGVKPFHVRLNADGKTVAAFDLIVPKMGILLSGSQSEERLDELYNRIKDLGLPEEQYEWYLDLRRHGTAKHSGFSLRLDLMSQFATSLPDVRDVIPFPRSLGKANN